MTERLSALLHQEVDRLDVPVPPVREALAAGRRLRRRHRLTQVAAVGGVLAMIGAVGIGAALLDGSGDPRTPSDDKVADTAATGEPVDLGPVFTAGRTLYLDMGARPVEMDEVVQAMYYTSVGLLVRTNADGSSDGGAPFHFQLVTDGSVTSVDLPTGEFVPSTDPHQPYVAYAEATDAGVAVVVRDVSTDEEVGRVPVEGLADWGGWEAPPVVLVGDTVYVSDAEHVLVVNWRTGDVRPAEHLEELVAPVTGGRTLALDRDPPGGDRLYVLQIIDVATGDALLTIDDMQAPWAVLSPDGSHAMVNDQVARDQKVYVYDLDSGHLVTMRGESWEFGWTSSSDFYSVDAGGLRTCDSDSGDCTTVPLPPDIDLEGSVLLGGRGQYES